MARERMVTRTVEEAQVKVMVVDTETTEVSTLGYNISATIPQAKALQYIQKHYDTATLKNVSIKEYTVKETLYGMSEQEFIKMAKILPPRTTAKTDEEPVPQEAPKKAKSHK